MGQFAQEWYAGKIKQITCMGIEAAYAALTKDDVWIACCHNVFGCQEPLVNRGRESAFEHDGTVLAMASGGEQKGKILHVAAADLQNIGILRYRLNHFRLHHFRNHRQTGTFAGFREQVKTFEAKSLKLVGRSTWLKRATTQNLCPSRLDCQRGLE